jgi:hypothetical protein
LAGVYFQPSAADVYRTLFDGADINVGYSAQAAEHLRRRSGPGVQILFDLE